MVTPLRYPHSVCSSQRRGQARVPSPDSEEKGHRTFGLSCPDPLGLRRWIGSVWPLGKVGP